MRCSSRTSVRRTDVRDEQRIYRAIVRIEGRGGVLFAALAVVLLLALPFIFPSRSILNSLVITGILYIAVLGLDVLMGYAGQVSLGQAGFMAIGGYTASILAVTYGVSPLWGTLAGIILSVLSCLLYTSPSPRDRQKSRMPSSA